jgi:cell division septation protein DedD
LRKRAPLPDGYRIEEAVFLRLFNPQGAQLEEMPQGPDAASAIEARAWNDAFAQVEREMKQELRALREGTRPLHDLRRLRQYTRMLDAMEQAPLKDQARVRSTRRRVIGGLALAAAAAVLGLFVVTTPFRVATTPERMPQTAQTTPRLEAGTDPAVSVPAPTSVVEPRLARAGSNQVRTGGTGRSNGTSRVSMRARSSSEVAQRPLLTGYAVSFGEFASRTSAEAWMHLIRAKGYLVYVAEVGDSYLVVTRPYRTREQADRLVSALQEIGLPATTQIAGTFLL